MTFRPVTPLIKTEEIGWGMASIRFGMYTELVACSMNTRIPVKIHH